MWPSLLLLLFIILTPTINGFLKPLRRRSVVWPWPISEGDMGETLFLTPILENGDYVEAQKLSRVTPDIGNITSYSGFFTVNKECDSHLFFWFFPAQKEDWKTAPLLLWLQGGPGGPSLYGLFEELGPFYLGEKDLKERKYSWNVENNLLFVDQPVGTAYSFTGKECYPENQTVVGEELYQAIVQFHQLFPQFQKNKFFISGESYAGHYIPALGHTIHRKNPSAQVKINLAGMMIGNPWTDPMTQSDYGNYLYQLGLIDDYQRDEYLSVEEECTDKLSDQDWSGAIPSCKSLTGYLFDTTVGYEMNIYNYLKPKNDFQSYEHYVEVPHIRKALHIGNLTYNSGQDTFENLLLDTLQSVKPWVEELLEMYPIIFYGGQLDIICAYPMTTKFLRSLHWSGQDQYMSAPRIKWCEESSGELAGYFKGEHNLYDVMLRGAGHMVPADQPLWAFNLVNSVTSGPSDDPLHALTKC